MVRLVTRCSWSDGKLPFIDEEYKLISKSIADLFTVIEAVIVAVYITARVWTYTGDFARMNTSLKKMQVSLQRSFVC